ncbi:amidase [Planctomyces sp. SH-PL62]|uniref:amidase n=1 Tax=Planctomyces sp. SH-PL62 TaxID=1636152 RepID=UPI00078D1AE8|nr:amidase [Planctomyces sp. SH-PL62]AMV36656.1 Glutamyl-tRNA(Gln) amidotransferase subunit A [Planctomyces sp. SH-PL62]
MSRKSVDPEEGPRGETRLRRRAVLQGLAALGFAGPVVRRALAAQAVDKGAVSPEMVRQAEWIAGVEFTDAERAEVAESVAYSLRRFEALRKVEIGYDVLPAIQFNPAPGLAPGATVERNRAVPIATTPIERPADEEELAFLPVSRLAELVRSRKLTSVELTKLYLGRLKRFDPLLKCVVTLTEDLALRQAAEADAEIAAGRHRGPLHGIPWGAKDLIAHPGYPTTWGVPQFKDRVIDVKATVAARLEEAGAVLVAKLSMGALAMGDRWHGGMTRSPWDPRRGSSGSSAGSASAAAAGLVGFAIGSETLGSIISPCRACGAAGLRPTFGRVSRHGCMSLSWTMDKIGPIARSVEDCALILDAIHGRDGLDPTAVDRPFAWPPAGDVGKIRIGVPSIDGKPADDRAEVRTLRALGFEMVPIDLPTDYPPWAVSLMLSTEAAAVFDELTRTHVSEGLNEWPETFRVGQLTPAVEYLRAARVRTLLMQAMDRVFDKVDVFLGWGGVDLTITNLTGHPSVIFPATLRDREGRPAPTTITLTGRLHDESTLLAVALACEAAVADPGRRPPLEAYLAAEAPRATS